jgi:PHD/YefM family antitoxin component YafN of YafNO toxin-antitoxin module
MEKLPISIGILAWNSGQVLVDTLTTYHNNGLFDMVNDVTILFQEVSMQDVEIATHFGLDFIGLQKNIGIGQAFIRLTENAETDNVLILEHDWNLIESRETTYERLQSGLELLSGSVDVVRYRHRKNPGYPHFSFQYAGKELTYYDKEIGATSPHLLDSVHWCNPKQSFPEHIGQFGEYFLTSARYANWTNNPCMYRKKFYLDVVKPFAGDGIALEGNIGRWWVQQKFGVAHGEGLFKHNDWKKYGLFSNIGGSENNLI